MLFFKLGSSWRSLYSVLFLYQFRSFILSLIVQTWHAGAGTSKQQSLALSPTAAFCSVTDSNLWLHHEQQPFGRRRAQLPLEAPRALMQAVVAAESHMAGQSRLRASLVVKITTAGQSWLRPISVTEGSGAGQPKFHVDFVARINKPLGNV